jgi:alkylated DNA repair protein alkB homolog 6
METTSSQSPLELQAYLLSDLPSSIYYIPAFLPSSTCESLLRTVNATPSHKWTNLSQRRLLSIPGPLMGKARDTLFLYNPLPAYLTDDIFSKFKGLGIFDKSPHGAPNHILVNEYLPSQGIMPHEDGPAYHPVTATVGLGSSTVLDIYSKTGPESKDCERKHWRILQEPGSLLVTMGDCYTDTLHGIAEVDADVNLRGGTIANWVLLQNKDHFRDGRNVRETRVSLTYRDVRKVIRVGGLRNSILGKR